MTLSPGLVIALDGIYEALRKRHPDLPRALITIEEPHPAVESRIACWRPGPIVTAAGIFEGRIAFGYPAPHRKVPRLLLTGPARDVLAALVHESAHALATVRDVQDTSRNGTYHNARFRDLADELGLQMLQVKTYGWAQDATPVLLMQRYRRQLEALKTAMPRPGSVPAQ
jgi:hypothetical protein